MSSYNFSVKHIFSINRYSVTFFCFLFIFLFNFIPSYQIGNNLDDKSFYLVSSQLAELNSSDRISIYQKFIEPLQLPNLELIRYQYRFNVVANTLLPSYLIRFFYYLFGKSEKALSIAFFFGYSLPFIGASILISYTKFTSNLSWKNFYNIYIITLIILLFFRFAELEPFKTLFSLSFAPGTSAPRGSAALLIPILFGTFIEKRFTLFFISSVLISLIHASSSLFMHACMFPMMILNFQNDKNYINSFLTLLLSSFLAFFLSQSFKVFPDISSLIFHSNIDSFDFINFNYLDWIIALSALIILVLASISKTNLVSKPLIHIGITILVFTLLFDLISDLDIFNDKLITDSEYILRFCGLGITFLISLIFYYFFENNLFNHIINLNVTLSKTIFIFLSGVFIFLSLNNFFFFTSNLKTYFSKLYNTTFIKISIINQDYSLYRKRMGGLINIPIKNSSFK